MALFIKQMVSRAFANTVFGAIICIFMVMITSGLRVECGT